VGVALLVALLAYALWRPSIPAWLFAAFCDLRSDQVPQCDHSRALVETENSAILTASEAITGAKRLGCRRRVSTSVGCITRS
jgi:hypothetical protein